MPVATLNEKIWQAARLAHEMRVERWVGPHLRRRSAGEAHPVEDFLFTYYSYSPASLRRWHPGLGVRLEGAGTAMFGSVKGYVVTSAGAEVDPGLAGRRADQVVWIHRLPTSMAGRSMALSCFGLHEWAMVYRQQPDQVRHATYPLRLGADATDTMVEQHRIACTHNDAFRFFTPDARARNTLRPTRETQHQHDQPGCLHATMDLYKWAYKLSPFTSAELVADCFALAREVRVVDMRAAPYDLTSLGVEPIRIETAEGKQEYIAAQRGFAERGRPLRQRLIDVCDRLLAP